MVNYSLEWFQTLSFQTIDKMFNTNLSRFLYRKLSEDENIEMQNELEAIENHFMSFTEEEIEEKYKMLN